jgi:hypothetical protein
MKSLEGIDRWIGRHMERLSAQLAGGSQPKEALEIRREILTEIRDKIEPRGDGEYVFPYQEIAVRLFAGDAEQRESLSVVFLDDASLENQVRELLAEAGCKGDVAIAAEVTEDAAATKPYRLDYKRIAKRPETTATPQSKRPAAWVHVLKGKTDKIEYFVAKDVIYIGRMKEVGSREGGLRRRNDVAFDDDENTVSREHAHIEFEGGRFRLFHDAGERGTKLFRDGRAVMVPPSGGRGTQLKSGDEIHLGEARLRFEISE